MVNAEIWLVDWFAQRVPNSNLAPEQNYFAAGAIDSLGIIELIEDMEQTFSVHFSQNDFQDERFVSIRGLSEILEGKTVS